jgi:hypothetical protein
VRSHSNGWPLSALWSRCCWLLRTGQGMEGEGRHARARCWLRAARCRLHAARCRLPAKPEQCRGSWPFNALWSSDARNFGFLYRIQWFSVPGCPSTIRGRVQPHLLFSIDRRIDRPRLRRALHTTHSHVEHISDRGQARLQENESRWGQGKVGGWESACTTHLRWRQFQGLTAARGPHPPGRSAAPSAGAWRQRGRACWAARPRPPARALRPRCRPSAGPSRRTCRAQRGPGRVRAAVWGEG